ncbi:hypothetical protein IG631_14010 [Alternaria alternata]|nr:hypothetical protein IG631_14010 [Alternaria alternata]
MPRFSGFDFRKAVGRCRTYDACPFGDDPEYKVGKVWGRRLPRIIIGRACTFSRRMWKQHSYALSPRPACRVLKFFLVF